MGNAIARRRIPRSRCSSRPHRVLLPKISPRTRLTGSRAPNKDRALFDVGDYAQLSLKGLLIAMASSNARKRAAREHQQRFPGTPYPVALRAVSHGEQALQVVIGKAGGHPFWVDIEAAASGGNGPHIAVIGPSEVGRRRVVELMIDSLSARPPRRGVKVLTMRGDISGTNRLIEERTRQLQHCGVRDFAELRRRTATEGSDLGDGGHAVVVVVDGDHLMESFVPVATRETDAMRPGDQEALTALNRLLRQGRSLDIHTVLNVRQIEGNPCLATAAGCISSIVEVDESGTAATWRSEGVRSAPVDVVLPVKDAEGSDQ